LGWAAATKIVFTRTSSRKPLFLLSKAFRSIFCPALPAPQSKWRDKVKLMASFKLKKSPSSLQAAQSSNKEHF
jgi:hypothetical protein